MAEFRGFVRADGGVGVRNHVLVLGVNGLAVRVAERIAGALPGVVCVASRDGRGQVEPDIASHRAQLLGLALNPNVGAVLVVGVDEEGTEGYRDAIAAAGRTVEAVSFAETGEDAFAVVDLGCRRLARLARDGVARPRREPAPLAGADGGRGVRALGRDLGHRRQPGDRRRGRPAGRRRRDGDRRRDGRVARGRAPAGRAAGATRGERAPRSSQAVAARRGDGRGEPAPA